MRAITPVNKNAVCEEPETVEAHEEKVGAAAKNQIGCQFEKRNLLLSRKDTKKGNQSTKEAFDFKAQIL